LGADQNGRDQLLSAWNFTRQLAPPYGKLYLLFPPSATSDNSRGLASGNADPAGTFLLKTNLTTVTQSGSLAALRQPAGTYFARLEAIPDFLRLAWEASITGSGGYYLNYATSGGAGLPDTLFADGNEATLTLLLLVDPQDRISHTDLGLYPFNNCAVVGDNIDPASSRLYARLATPEPSDLVRVATVMAGNAGFYMARTNPDPGSFSPTGPDAQTRNLYNLSGFRIAGNAYFEESNQGLPAGPADTPVSGVSGPTGPGVWWYQQVLPVSKFGKANQTPASPALPLPAENPYAGITGPTSSGPLSSVVIDLAFHDIYGNRTFSPTAVGPVTATVGYADELIGLSSWPGAAADFLFAPGLATEVRLESQITSAITRYVPAASYGFEQSSTAAKADALRYGQIFYQVQQLDLGFRLETNLGTASIAADALKAPLTAFVSKTKVAADAAAALGQRAYATLENDKLAVIAGTYNVSVGALLEANADQLVQPLFKGKVVQPMLATAGPMNTLELLVKDETSTPYPPTCDPDGPSCSDPQGATLTVVELASRNLDVALTPGIVLRTATLVTKLPDVANILVDVAGALHSVVYDEVTDPADPTKTIPIGLFQDNLTIAGVVAPELEIEIDGFKVTTGPAPTFKSVQDSFAVLGLSTGDFVRKMENKKGIFAAAASIAHASFEVPSSPPTTLASVPAGSGSIELLATQNRVVTNFFATGSSIYIGYCCYAPQPFDTFASLAQKFHGISLGQFGQFNGNASLKAGAELLIPNLTFLTDSAPVYSPYSPTPKDSLATIAQTFASTVPAIAAINRYLPGIFADGASITIGNTLNPKPLDSLESMANQFSLPFDTFIDKISAMRGLYRQNGVVIAGRALVPDHGGASPAFADLARSFNVQSQTAAGTNSAPILAMNRCLERFLREGAVIAGPAGSTPILVGAHDTLDTVIRAFHERQKLDLTVEQIAEYNAATANLLTVGRAFLLPPSPTRITTSVAPQIPPSGTTCESKIVFPVGVTVEMARNRTLVAPDFARTPPVFINTSTLSPRGWNQDANSLNLTAFAWAFEEAFANFRLKSAVSKRDALSDPKQAGQLWAVNFGASGLSKVVVDSAAPQFYALAPLSTDLMSGSLAVRSYRSGCGLCETLVKTFDSVDLDNWMFQFLSTVDLFLSAPYSTPAFLATGLTGAAGLAELPEPRRADGPVGFVGRELSSSSMFAGFAGETGCTGCTGAMGTDGPVNFDDIVESKLTIADRLKRDVFPILNGVGATGGYYLQVAQEAFYQQMLVRLADAYSINAVVQYPVGMQSPCITPPPPAGPTAIMPPRVSGKIVPDLYTIPSAAGNPATTLAGAAEHFGVSAPFLAETIGNAQGLLRTDAEVEYKLPPKYVVKASDTLNNVAAHFEVESDPNAPGYWETWTPFIEAIAAQSILVAGGVVPVVGIARKVNAGDALSTIADFFGVDAATTGEANQSLPGIFIAGRAINIPGYPQYIVQANDTLAKIAGGMGIPVSTLARGVATRTDLLAQQTLSLTQSMPDVTLSTTKISMGRVGSASGPDPALSFLVSLKHPRQYKSLFLNLKYVINEMEYQIASVAGEGDYRKSSWLTFLLPIGSGEGADVGVDTQMEQVQIPIPLRAYPIPPTVTAQSGLRTPQLNPPVNPDRAVAEGKQWDYRLDFQSSNAAQDTDHVQVSFNAFPPGFRAAGLTRTDLVFRALAEFMDAYPQLTADLAILPTLQPGQVNRTASVAVAVLDTFAANVAYALSASTASLAVGQQFPELKYLYRLATQAANDQLKELQLGMDLGPSGAPYLWPDVLIQSLTAPTAGTGPDAGFLELTRLGASGQTATFGYPVGFPTGARLTQRFLFHARDVMQNQNAMGGIYVTRNDDLISSGPVGTGSGPQGSIPTNSAFVYQTPLITFIDRLTPFVVDPSAINIAGLTGPAGKRTLAQHIETMLDAVLELSSPIGKTIDNQLSMLCSYGFVVAGTGPDELVAKTPIRLVPTQPLNAASKAKFASDLAASIKNWPGWPGSSDTGMLVLDVSVFTIAAGPTGPEANLKPILEFENLQVPISAIGDKT
jgi:LysM repeat protein